MKNLFRPLTEKELDRLERFLLERIDTDADTEGMDEGVLDISELDGLLTALVSGPDLIPPSKWLVAVWGGFEPIWNSEQEFQLIFSLMIRHMNDIAATLMEQPEDFEPIFMERVVEDKTYAVVDEWCEGYMRGVKLAADRWSTGGPQMAKLLIPIQAFTGETEWQGHDLPNHGDVERIQNAIASNVREIHAYWLARRENEAPASEPKLFVEPRVGRNDPCPCGSGKKCKKCCLH